MQLVLEGRDDAEVAAASSDGPEQVRVLLGAGPQQTSVSGHDVGGYEVVAREPVAAVQPPQPAAEREPRDPSHRDDSEGRGQPERLGRAVELAQGEPGFGPRRPRLGIDLDGFHPGQVDHESAVVRGVACDAVTAPAHCEREVVPTCECDGANHVGRIDRPDHGQGPTVDHAVEQRAGRVVAAVTREDDFTPQTSLGQLTNSAIGVCENHALSVKTWFYKHKRSYD